MKYSERITTIQSSPIRKLAPLANIAKDNGIKIYHLNIGQPDIKTPKGFFDEVKKFDSEVLKYIDSPGLPELISSLQQYYAIYKMHFESDEILITNGGSEALLFSLMATCDPKENILVPEPFYSNYNITGTVYTKKELYMISEIAKENDLWIISDEVYREFVYDGLEYTSFGSIKEVEDRVIIIDSVSKKYSACGARIGSIASKNKTLIAEILKLCQGRLCVSTLNQIGSVELYNTPLSYFMDVNNEYKNRRDVLYNELIKIKGVICKKPFYIIAKLPVENAEDFVIWMLTDFNKDGETVMACPAKDFYSTPGLGRNEIRLSYVLNEDDLHKAAIILKEGLEKYLELKK